MVSDFPAFSGFFVIHKVPDPLVIEDNVVRSAGPRSLVMRRERPESGAAVQRDSSLEFPNNSLLEAGDFAVKAPVANTAGPYAARRFTGTTYLGTGSAPYEFITRGAF